MILTKNETSGKADFSQSRNDISWTIWHCGEDRNMERIYWSGYNDGFWWQNVSKSYQFQIKTTKDGTRYRLDPESDIVTRAEAKS